MFLRDWGLDIKLLPCMSLEFLTGIIIIFSSKESYDGWIIVECSTNMFSGKWFLKKESKSLYKEVVLSDLHALSLNTVEELF